MKPTHKQPTTSEPVPAMTPAMLLRSAAAYLRSHGWIQGSFFLTFAPEPFPPACTAGAISVCAHGRPVLSSDDDADDADTDDAITAMRILAAYLDPEYGTHAPGVSAIDVIGDWNDDKGRTLDEVTEALTDAAHDWDRLHPTGGAR